MIPGPYAVCIISFDKPDSDTATYRVIKYGHATAEQAFRDLDEFKRSREYSKKDLLVIQHVERDSEE